MRIVLENVEVLIGEQDHIYVEDLYVDKPSKTLYVGETGSGKTVLLKTLSGIARDVYGMKISGKIVVDGSTHYVPQEPWSIVFGRNGLEELTFLSRNSLDPSIIPAGYRELLFKKIREMSYGERRLLDLLKTYVYNPDILLVDEPYESLDDRNKEFVEELFNNLLDSGKIILATSKKPREGWVVRRVYNRGWVVRDDPPIGMRIGGNGLVLLEDAYIVRGGRRINLPNIVLKPGDAGVVYGCNGCGKTSLLLGLAGSVKVKGLIRVVGDVGIVPDDVSLLYSWYSVRDVVRDLCRGSGDCVENSFNVLTCFGVDPYNKPYIELSDGMKRIVLLIATLSRNPDILLIDGGLEYIDHGKALVIKNYLEEYVQHGGILLTTLPRGVDHLEYEEGLILFNN